VASAFDGVDRKRMMKLMVKEVGNYAFFKLYSKVLDELTLIVDLGFDIFETKSKVGCPQGLKMSCFF